jgi:hypothetical protein
VDGDTTGGKLVQQARYRGRYLAVTRYHHRPFKALSELSRADAPSIEKWRRCRSDLNERPVSNECERGFPVRQGAAHDEMIVAVYQKTYVKVTPHTYICNTGVHTSVCATSIAEGAEWIDPGGAPGGQEAGGDRSDRHHQERQAEGQRVARTDLVE